MKRFLAIALVVLSVQVKAQDLSGQWKGGFVSDGDYYRNRTEYVLELEIKGEEVDGYSYTYFEIRGKRCYVICHLTGSFDKKAKSVWVKEIEKVKANTPPDFLDCFQIHELSFVDDDGTEKLVGRWKPASKGNNCGTGSTELERKTLVRVAPQKQNDVVKAPPSKTTDAVKTTPKTTPPKTTAKTTPKAAPKAATAPPVVSSTKPKTQSSTTTKSSSTTTTSTKPKTTTTTGTKPPATTKTEQKPKSVGIDTTKTAVIATVPAIKKPIVSEFENRSKKVLKTIVVEDDELKVDLYDNGEIDGDSVSVFFNGKLKVTHQRLSDKPITLKIKLDPEVEDNDLVMFAENLGSIPPNTALMIVTVGDQRFEVRITSTEQTSGTVRFKLKEE